MRGVTESDRGFYEVCVAITDHMEARVCVHGFFSIFMGALLHTFAKKCEKKASWKMIYSKL